MFGSILVTSFADGPHLSHDAFEFVYLQHKSNNVGEIRNFLFLCHVQLPTPQIGPNCTLPLSRYDAVCRMASSIRLRVSDSGNAWGEPSDVPENRT